jgi:hypothetical protein
MELSLSGPHFLIHLQCKYSVDTDGELLVTNNARLAFAISPYDAPAEVPFRTRPVVRSSGQTSQPSSRHQESNVLRCRSHFEIRKDRELGFGAPVNH